MALTKGKLKHLKLIIIFSFFLILSLNHDIRNSLNEIDLGLVNINLLRYALNPSLILQVEVNGKLYC